MVRKFKQLKKILCFDLDGVICNTPGNEYKKSKPIIKNIKKINDLYDKGFKIIVYTARFMNRSNENVKVAHKKGFKFTFNQLQKWNLKFDVLKFGKPSYDLIIDDKGLFYKKNCFTEINKYL